MFQKYVNPYQLNKYQSTLLTLLRTGINGAINNKVEVLEFNGIRALLSGKLLTN